MQNILFLLCSCLSFEKYIQRCYADKQYWTEGGTKGRWFMVYLGFLAFVPPHGTGNFLLHSCWSNLVILLGLWRPVVRKSIWRQHSLNTRVGVDVPDVAQLPHHPQSYTFKIHRPYKNHQYQDLYEQSDFHWFLSASSSCSRFYIFVFFFFLLFLFRDLVKLHNLMPTGFFLDFQKNLTFLKA